jgi:hypothetical protein
MIDDSNYGVENDLAVQTGYRAMIPPECGSIRVRCVDVYNAAGPICLRNSATVLKFNPSKARSAI